MPRIIEITGEGDHRGYDPVGSIEHPEGGVHPEFCIAKGEAVSFHFKVTEAQRGSTPAGVHGQFTLVEYGSTQTSRFANLSTSPNNAADQPDRGTPSINPSAGFYTAPQDPHGKGGHVSGRSKDPVFPVGSDVYWNVQNDPDSNEPTAALGGVYGSIIMGLGFRDYAAMEAKHPKDEGKHHRNQ